MSIEQPYFGGPLSQYRALDLTQGGYNWCGRVLADLGVDVIKVEPPGGSPTRLRGPFYRDQVDPEGSLYWFAYCLNKRGITLDLEADVDRERFRELAAGADFVLESFAPGYLDGLGLGYDDLASVNPGLVMTSMTPFGQTGPYAHYKATDFISWSMGGMTYPCGDADRAPARIGVPQAELVAGAQGAGGSMTAFRHRRMTGEGQHVDVSAQVAVVWTLMNATPFPPLHGVNVERSGPFRGTIGFDSRLIFQCKDGFVTFMMAAGDTARLSISPVLRWMEEEDAAGESLLARDWTEASFADILEQGDAGVAEINALQQAIETFFATKTKAELYDRALSERILLAPCQTVNDIAADPQLDARRFWVDVDHPELEETLTYPGPFIKLSETPLRNRRRAPRIGEHNDEVLSAASKGPSDPPAAPATRPERRSSVDAPFAGLRVLDFTWVAVGPVTTKYLADHGADVVRVESVIRPDVLRAVPPFKDAEPGFNRSQFPASYNTNKYGLGLNMAFPEAKDLVRRIIRDWQPDIIAENFTPKAMRAWGLDYASVAEIKPDIIYFSTCQQGQTGPRSHYAGFGQLAASLSGFYYLTGWPDRGPVGPYGAYSDFVNPPNALAAIVAALEHRDRTGKGQHLDLAQYECAIHFLAPAVLDYTVNGRVAQRRGNGDDAYAPHGAYPCVDEPRSLTGLGPSWCAIAVTSEAEWDALCHVMGSPSWTADPRFATFEARRENAEELDRLLGAWTSQYPAQELMRILQAAGVPAGAVQSQADLWDDPQLKHREFFQWLDHTECGPMPYDGLQFLLSKTPGRLRTPHALVGEHSEQVLKEFVGLSDDEFTELIAQGVLEFS